HQIKDQYRILKQFPFDSTRKRMTVIVEDENKRRFLIAKGAPEVIIPRCAYQAMNQERVLLKEKTRLQKQIDQMAENALRMIAIAVKPLQKNEVLTEAAVERNLTFVGLYGLKDPPRKEVKQAISQCKEAGVRTVMITGDHQKTAIAIADEVGIVNEESSQFEGKKLNAMTSSK